MPPGSMVISEHSTLEAISTAVSGKYDRKNAMYVSILTLLLKVMYFHTIFFLSSLTELMF